MGLIYIYLACKANCDFVLGPTHANTKHSPNNSQNVPDLLLLYENICITFGEYSVSGNIIRMFYRCFDSNNSQSIPDLFLS